MKTRLLVITALILAAGAAGCGTVAARKVERIRRLETPAEKVPLLAEYLGYKGGARVVRAAKDGLADVGVSALPYLKAALREKDRGRQARVNLLLTIVEIERSGAVLMLLDLSRDHDEAVYLRAEALRQLGALRWKAARPYMEHLRRDETEPMEIRRAASAALRRM